MSYHQTTPMDPHSLRAAVAQAVSQEAAVLAIFQRLRRPLTPSDVHRITTQARKDAGLPEWPITSIRRAMSDLAREDGAPLVKTDTLRKGLYHLPEHAWELATPAEQTVPPARAMTGA